MLQFFILGIALLKLYHTLGQVSSPLGTQIPQAVGVAYKKKLEFISGKSDESGVSAVYFGDGAASTGDFYSACTFAATLKVPVSSTVNTSLNG